MLLAIAVLTWSHALPLATSTNVSNNIELRNASRNIILESAEY